MTVLLVEDHPVFRNALSAVIARMPGHPRVREADSLREALQCVREQRFDLVLLDLRLTDSSGLAGLGRLSVESPDQPVVVLSASESLRTAHLAQVLGARGLIPKSAPVSVIRAVLSAILRGEHWAQGVPQATVASSEQLTTVQKRILLALVDGMQNRQIAQQLSVTEATIKAHLTQIFRKLGTHNRTQSVILMRSLDPDMQ